ncbi:MAG TPA: hypothetical protein PLE35_02210 [Lentisphaeria bacterium]|nr:hypothetical protein [Lentisphaeria bacterium]
MGDAEDIMQSILHESDTEARRKAFIRELAQAVAREIPRECPLGLTPDELRGLRNLSGCYSKGTAALVSFMSKIAYAIVFSAVAALLGKIGMDIAAGIVDKGAK